MKNQPTKPVKALWRRKLSAAEHAALQPEPELEVEARLTQALAAIPNAPVPSNFTARVLAAVDLEEARAARAHSWALNWRALWPRVAVAAAVLVFAGVSLQQHKANQQRAALTKNLALVARSPLPGVDALENLDAIQRMSQSSHADNELLAVLQ